jgi:nucleoside-diphosphate-sugar epimerase
MAEKNFLVLGGAGKSGIHVVKQALEMGHKVTAYARSTTSLKEQHGDAIENQKLTVSFHYSLCVFLLHHS